MSQHNIGGAYRPDIDGLRAIAVLAVIFFHLEETLLPGGFAGVDVFFVISGYLISLNLFQGLDAGRFSIVDFYRRRVKRIAPPMLVVIAATLILCHFLFLPEDTERASESALWSLHDELADLIGPDTSSVLVDQCMFLVGNSSADATRLAVELFGLQV